MTAYEIANDYQAGIIPQVVKSVDGGSALIGQWEMKNGNIQMRNPAWYPFVQKIAVRAAEYLGINSDAGAVGAKLVKARLLTAGASMPPHKEWVVRTPWDCFCN